MQRLSKVSLVLISLFVGTFLSPLFYCGGKDHPLFLGARDRDLSPARKNAVSLQNAFEEVFEEVAPSVVSIATERTVDVRMDPFFEYFYGRSGRHMKQKQNGLGSGVILNKEGFILTNDHVVKGWDKFVVRLRNKKEFEAKLIGSSAHLDLALLKIAASEDLQPAILGDSSEVKVGNWAIAIGAPLGFEHSFTVGVVSAVARAVDASGLSYLQTDAAINQGNSGGPLLNIYGEVIGINRMIVSQGGGSDGIGFSIPINEAKRILPDLKEGKQPKGPPWLGIGIVPVTEEFRKELGLKKAEGVIISEIHEKSPALKASLQVMDVIVELDGQEIKDPKQLVEIVRKAKAGQRIKIRLIRGGRAIVTTIVPEERPF